MDIGVKCCVCLDELEGDYFECKDCKIQWCTEFEDFYIICPKCKKINLNIWEVTEHISSREILQKIHNQIYSYRSNESSKMIKTIQIYTRNLYKQCNKSVHRDVSFIEEMLNCLLFILDDFKSQRPGIHHLSKFDGEIETVNYNVPNSNIPALEHILSLLELGYYLKFKYLKVDLRNESSKKIIEDWYARLHEKFFDLISLPRTIRNCLRVQSDPKDGNEVYSFEYLIQYTKDISLLKNILRNRGHVGGEIFNNCPKCRNGIVYKQDEVVCCATCRTTFCHKCNKEISDNHVCRDEDIELLTHLLENTKPCPSCGFRFEKYSGCNEMFCTNCKASFDWRTLQIVRPSHNPERTIYLNRQTINFIKMIKDTITRTKLMNCSITSLCEFTYFIDRQKGFESTGYTRDQNIWRSRLRNRMNEFGIILPNNLGILNINDYKSNGNREDSQLTIISKHTSTRMRMNIPIFEEITELANVGMDVTGFFNTEEIIRRLMIDQIVLKNHIYSLVNAENSINVDELAKFIFEKRIDLIISQNINNFVNMFNKVNFVENINTLICFHDVVVYFNTYAKFAYKFGLVCPSRKMIRISTSFDYVRDEVVYKSTNSISEIERILIGNSLDNQINILCRTVNNFNKLIDLFNSFVKEDAPVPVHVAINIVEDLKDKTKTKFNVKVLITGEVKIAVIIDQLISRISTYDLNLWKKDSSISAEKFNNTTQIVKIFKHGYTTFNQSSISNFDELNGKLVCVYYNKVTKATDATLFNSSTKMNPSKYKFRMIVNAI